MLISSKIGLKNMNESDQITLIIFQRFEESQSEP